MADQSPWIRAEMGGTKQASLISKPEILMALLKKSRRPLFIIGYESISPGIRNEMLIRLATVLQKTEQIPVLSTAHIAGGLISRGFTPDATLGSMETISRLCDSAWKGLDGKGQYNLILIGGFSYTLGSLLLSGLKQGAPGTKVISLDPKYHPHATWSFANLKPEAWQTEIERCIELITRKNMEESHV